MCFGREFEFRLLDCPKDEFLKAFYKPEYAESFEMDCYDSLNRKDSADLYGLMISPVRVWNCPFVTTGDCVHALFDDPKARREVMLAMKSQIECIGYKCKVPSHFTRYDCSKPNFCHWRDGEELELV
jgi:hypothetical protein